MYQPVSQAVAVLSDRHIHTRHITKGSKQSSRIKCSWVIFSLSASIKMLNEMRVIDILWCRSFGTKNRSYRKKNTHLNRINVERIPQKSLNRFIPLCIYLSLSMEVSLLCTMNMIVKMYSKLLNCIHCECTASLHIEKVENVTRMRWFWMLLKQNADLCLFSRN